MTKEEISWIKRALRRASYRWPARAAAKSAARVRRGIYLCTACQNEHRAKDIQLDHLRPVSSFDDWNGYVERMFPAPDGWQVLCVACHKEKSAAEATARAN